MDLDLAIQNTMKRSHMENAMHGVMSDFGGTYQLNSYTESASAAETILGTPVAVMGTNPMARAGEAYNAPRVTKSPPSASPFSESFDGYRLDHSGDSWTLYRLQTEKAGFWGRLSGKQDTVGGERCRPFQNFGPFDLLEEKSFYKSQAARQVPDRAGLQVEIPGAAGKIAKKVLHLIGITLGVGQSQPPAGDLAESVVPAYQSPRGTACGRGDNPGPFQLFRQPTDNRIEPGALGGGAIIFQPLKFYCRTFCDPGKQGLQSIEIEHFELDIRGTVNRNDDRFHTHVL